MYFFSSFSAFQVHFYLSCDNGLKNNQFLFKIVLILNGVDKLMHKTIESLEYNVINLCIPFILNDNLKIFGEKMTYTVKSNFKWNRYARNIKQGNGLKYQLRTKNYVIGDQGNELFKACYRFIFTDEGNNYEILDEIWKLIFIWPYSAYWLSIFINNLKSISIFGTWKIYW